MKLHLAGLAAASVSVAGMLLELIPIVQGHVPSQYAWIVLALGIVCQAITKGVQHGGTILVSTNGH